MANVRDSDTSLWLHNKLGTSNDSWTGGSICTQLNNEVLRNIKDCFPDLQTQVKLKLLLSFFHIPRRNVEEWRHELEEILEIASLDSELWVSMLAEMMKTLPSTGSLNTHRPREVDETRPVFSDMVTDLKKLLQRHEEQLHMLPLECHYLNKPALTSVVGQQPNPVKHFTLKRKPKSAALRAELLQKCSDAMSNQKKSVAPTVPIRSRGMPRKMTDTTPLKGLPSRWSLGRGGVRTPARPNPPPTARKDGGIKLLDIADQPATIHQKKRRKLLEAEELQQQKKAAAEAEVSATPQAATAAGGTGQAGTLPEYARGLNNYVMPSTPQDQGLPPLTTAQSPAVTPVTPTAGQTSPSTPLTPTTPHPHPAPTITSPPVQISPPQITNNQTTTPLTAKHPIIIQQTPGQKPTGIVIQQQPKLLITGQGQKPLLVTAGPGGTLLSGQNILKTSTGVPVIFANSSMLQQNQQGQAILTQQGGKTVLLTNVKQMNPSLVQQGGNVIIQTQQVAGNPPGLVLSNPVQVQQQNAQQQGAQQIQAQQQQNVAAPAGQDATQRVQQQPQQAGNLLPRRGLTLTREQMIEAQDMFKNANRVTRPEKALILGFMAGSRDNPCPNLGNIVTIKLSENPENVRQADNTYLLMLCETHFQMNYNNGQWMRIKKLRPIEGAVPQPIPQHITS